MTIDSAQFKADCDGIQESKLRVSMNKLSEFPVHLGLGATAVAEPAFDGEMSWYQNYTDRHQQDGSEGRLVSMHTFHQPWDSWEMHPSGAEVVICTSGSITLIQERENGTTKSIKLQCGDFAINDPGVWHTADVATTATAVFITAGIGTQHRPREHVGRR